MPAPVVITGHAYGRRATLAISGDTLTWRAERGMPPVRENIVTTVHGVRFARWRVGRWSYPGLALAALGALWVASETIAPGAAALALATGLIGWRHARPHQQLVLELGDPADASSPHGGRRLIMRVALGSAAPARALADRVGLAIASGERPASPPALP